MKLKYWILLAIIIFIIGSIALAQRGCNYITYLTWHECWCFDENNTLQGYIGFNCYDCTELCEEIRK